MAISTIRNNAWKGQIGGGAMDGGRLMDGWQPREARELIVGLSSGA